MPPNKKPLMKPLIRNKQVRKKLLKDFYEGKLSVDKRVKGNIFYNLKRVI